MRIQVQFSTKSRSFKTSFNASDQSFTPGFEALQKDVPQYNGKYEVIPLADGETTLMTANKIMRDNVTVKQIPYFETSNNADGETVYIGAEVDIYGD